MYLNVVARISAIRDSNGPWTSLRRLRIWARICCVCRRDQPSVGGTGGLVLGMFLLMLILVVEEPKERFLFQMVSRRERCCSKKGIERTENGAVSNVSGLSSGVIEYVCLFISDGESGGESRALICSGRGRFNTSDKTSRG